MCHVARSRAGTEGDFGYTLGSEQRNARGGRHRLVGRDHNTRCRRYGSENLQIMLLHVWAKGFVWLTQDTADDVLQTLKVNEILRRSVPQNVIRKNGLAVFW